MKSELSFLIELLLNHELPKPTKDLLAVRIREVEENISKPMFMGGVLMPPAVPNPVQPTFTVTPQAPSTLALMAKHGDIPPVTLPPQAPPPEPVAVIAQTPATMAALQSRQEAIAAALNNKVDKVSGKPRKW